VLRGEIVVLDAAQAAAREVRDGTVRVTIPAGFARAFADAGTTSINIAYSYSSGLATTVAARIFGVLTTTFNAETANVPLPARLEFSNTTNSKPVGQLQYLLTGILIMSMMTAGMNNACVGIVAQRERNTFKLMSCLPLKPIVYLTSILSARIVVLFVAAFVLLLGARYVYDIDMPLSAWQLLNAAGLILIGGTTLLSIGVAMSSRIARVPTAIVLCNVVYMSLLFASDLTMPLSSYPDTVRPLLLALPTTQFAAALRAILVQGSDLIAQWKIVLSLGAWSAGCLLFSRAAFRWHEV
jgi:ABC-2 type transport system permease protein